MQFYLDIVERNRERIFEVERYIWKHPESGYKEWNTSKYLGRVFEEAGYTLTYAENIPGFYTDIDTGNPGPKILIMAEMDALVAPTHPENWNGCAHACGHHAQCAALVGIALALKEPGALNNLCGSIRLMAVPAEELIEIEYRDQLRKDGIIHYMGGKVEFMYRGYVDGCDIAYVFHTGDSQRKQFECDTGANGCTAKEVVYKGIATHAGGAPHLGVNAMYAATMGLNAINSIRETFQDNDHIRVHPIMEANSGAVNIIPAKATISTFIRGASMEAIINTNRSVNRALASGALAVGAEVEVADRPGYAPLINSPELVEISRRIMSALIGPDQVKISGEWSTISTDMGDLSTIMPVLHPYIAGATGRGHGDDYFLVDPENACIRSAQGQVLLAVELLKDGARQAKQVIEAFKPRYATKEAYFEAVNQLMADRNLVTYTKDGAVVSY